jgi:hypothetical protein
MEPLVTQRHNTGDMVFSSIVHIKNEQKVSKPKEHYYRNMSSVYGDLEYSESDYKEDHDDEYDTDNEDNPKHNHSEDTTDENVKHIHFSEDYSMQTEVSEENRDDYRGYWDEESDDQTKDFGTVSNAD